MKVNDFLYGAIDASNYSNLLETPEMQRLSGLHLNCLPLEFKGIPVTASRLEHSLGVMQLAGILSKQDALLDQKTLLEVSSLVHDIGTGPFGHTFDVFMRSELGVTHDARCERILKETSVKDAISELGLQVSTVYKMVLGENKPLSDAINSEFIDVDNIDNTLRFSVKVGITGKDYDPEILTKALEFRDGFVLKNSAKELIPKWFQVRVDTYNFIYEGTCQAAGGMTIKSMQLFLEKQEVPTDFFNFTDTQTSDFLFRQKDSSPLMNEIKNQQIHEEVLVIEDARKLTLSEKLVFERELQEKLSLTDNDLCSMQINKDRNRSVHIPFEDGSFYDNTTKLPTTRLNIYVVPSKAKSARERLMAMPDLRI
ncbi:MAG: HD domain-containing protein [Candidatus Diapherotrites archaeon]|nr:HD domain-containing protein [Candidatus Diapherotrites archaeon]